MEIRGRGIWGIINLRSPKSPISSKSSKSQNFHIKNLKKLRKLNLNFRKTIGHLWSDGQACFYRHNITGVPTPEGL